MKHPSVIKCPYCGALKHRDGEITEGEFVDLLDDEARFVAYRDPHNAGHG